MSRASEKLKHQAFIKADGKCTYCGLDSRLHPSVMYAMEIDHIPPYTDSPDNVVLCCPHCNKMIGSSPDANTIELRRAKAQRGLKDKQEWFDIWMKELDSQSFGNDTSSEN